MAKIVLTRGNDGKLAGLSAADQLRWDKFLSRVKALAPGDTVAAEFKLPRSPGFHRRHFAVLGALFAHQEQFADFEKFRQWVQVGAGFCDIVPGPKGRMVAVSRSIAWENLEDADFAAHHADVMAFVRSPHFARFLWPDTDPAQADAGLEAILSEFDR